MDIAAANALLDAWLGDGKAAGMPASHALELWAGDPDNEGTQLDATGGYAPVTLANTSATWPAAASGKKTTAPTLVGTGSYNALATHFRLVSAGVTYFVGELDTPVSAATDTTEVVITLEDD